MGERLRSFFGSPDESRAFVGFPCGNFHERIEKHFCAKSLSEGGCDGGFRLDLIGLI